MCIKYKNTIFTVAIYCLLTMSQTSLAAFYTSPANDDPGSLHFENVQVDNSINVSAQLTATDKDNIYAGQVYQLNLEQLTIPSGVQDATYDSLSQKIKAQTVTLSATQEYDVILQLTHYKRDTNTYQFTIIELQSKLKGADDELTEQMTSFFQGYQGVSPENTLTASKFYIIEVEDSAAVSCKLDSHIIIAGGTTCGENQVVQINDRVSDGPETKFWGGVCVDITTGKFHKPDKISISCLTVP